MNSTCDKQMFLGRLGLVFIFFLSCMSVFAEDGGRKSLQGDVKESVLSVFQANEDLHTAFFNYDGKKVEEEALKVKAAIDLIKDTEISNLLTFSKEKLAAIKASNTRDENNRSYHLVSMALIHIINQYDLGGHYNAYSCPMVKMKWVQNSKKIDEVYNPYAPGMAHCGSKDSNY